MVTITPRQSELLHLLVEQYIHSAAPVSSGSLVHRFELDVSSATVRHELAELETEGFVARTHTSAGAVPTEQGYRYYVEVLLQALELPADQQETIRHQFHQVESDDANRWIRLAAATLARRVTALAIITPLHVTAAPVDDQPFVYGFSQVLNQPEFVDRYDMVRELLEAVEVGRLVPALHLDQPAAGGVRVIIGHEHVDSFLHPYSVVVGSYGGAERMESRGTVAVLGPTRMDYSSAIPSVRYLVGLLTQLATASADPEARSTQGTITVESRNDDD